MLPVEFNISALTSYIFVTIINYILFEEISSIAFIISLIVSPENEFFL